MRQPSLMEYRNPDEDSRLGPSGPRPQATNEPTDDDAKRRPAGDSPTPTTGFVTRPFGVRTYEFTGDGGCGFDSARPFQ
jgi:hypothetical protein